MTAASVASTCGDGAPVVQPAGASRATVAMGITDGDIGGFTIAAAYSQAEVQALRDQCEELADDVRALAALVNAGAGQGRRRRLRPPGSGPLRLTVPVEG